MPKDLIIIGASGHGKVVADIARQLMSDGCPRYGTIYFLDDDTSKTVCGKYPVIGTTHTVNRYLDADMFVAIGDATIRKNMVKCLETLGIHIPVMVHPRATIGEGVSVGVGSIIQAGTVIDPDVRIGKGCIINKCVNVSHDCVVGEYVHIAPGAHICGNVRIGHSSWIGAGATIVQGLRICDNCMIGAGAVVVNNIKEAGTYVGVPAKRRAG